jgi:ribosomal protein S18 acetylase RimI-like enzyme
VIVRSRVRAPVRSLIRSIVQPLVGSIVRSLAPTTVLVRLLQAEDVASFLTWRGDSAYKRSIAEKHLAEHRASARVIFVAIAWFGRIGHRLPALGADDGVLDSAADANTASAPSPSTGRPNAASSGPVRGTAVVGTIQLVYSADDPELADGSTCAYLEALDVVFAFRRQGIASRLVDAAANLAANRGFSRLTTMVEPDNAPSLALFTRLGFREFKCSTHLWRDRSYPTICLVRALGGSTRV